MENTNGNGKIKSWGNIKVMARKDVPPRGASLYWDLYLQIRDQVASVIQDPNEESLFVPFEDLKSANAAQAALRKLFADRGPNVSLEVHKDDYGATMYVSVNPEPGNER